jgi:hypothetical protein
MSDYEFEAPEEDALDGTLERPLLASQLSVPNGHITFGDPDNLNSTLDHARHYDIDALSLAEHLDHAHCSLFGAWALAVSHTGVWTIHHEEALSNVVHNLGQLFHLLLTSKGSLLKELDELQGVPHGKKSKSNRQSRGLKKALHLFTSLLSLLPLDSLHRNAHVCVLDLIHSLVSQLATNQKLNGDQPHAQTLQGCYALLRHSEVMLQKSYGTTAGVVQNNGDPYTFSMTPCNPHLFSPSLSESPRSVASDQTLPKQPLNSNQNAHNSTPPDFTADSSTVNR